MEEFKMLFIQSVTNLNVLYKIVVIITQCSNSHTTIVDGNISLVTLDIKFDSNKISVKYCMKIN
jgi:hypothetical protein